MIRRDRSCWRRCWRSAASPLRTAAVQDVTFRTDDGVTIGGTLYLPARPGPAVILVHVLSRSREDWRPVASRLADAGFVALAIDLRGHGASGPLPEGASLENLTGMMADVKAARAFLRRGARRRQTGSGSPARRSARTWPFSTPPATRPSGRWRCCRRASTTAGCAPRPR